MLVKNPVLAYYWDMKVGDEVKDYGNKVIFAENLRRYMTMRDKTQTDVAAAINVSKSTFNDWYSGKTYPRIDKIEMLADFFGILKSDLIENKARDKDTNTKQYLLDARRLTRVMEDPDLRRLVDAAMYLPADELRAVTDLVERLGLNYKQA